MKHGRYNPNTDFYRHHVYSGNHRRVWVEQFEERFWTARLHDDY